MLSQRIEGRVLNLVDRVVSGERVEDALVECKAEWPSAARAARQIAGHANAARGEPILWIIGVDEDGHQVASASDVELANWWSQVTAVFDQGITPGLTTLVVPVGTAQSVVALYLTTDRAPYVVSRPEQRSSFDREVPWRDGNRTRSAYRDELLRMLVEAVLPPEATVVRLELRALHRTAEQRAGRPEVPEHVELYLWGYLFFGPPSGPVVVLPAHLMTGQLDFAEHQPRPGALEPLPISVKLAQRSLPGPRMIGTSRSGFESSTIDPHPLGVDVRLGDAYLMGPGTLTVSGSAQVPIGDRDALLAVKRLLVHLTFPVAGGDRPVLMSTRLERTGEDRSELARWMAT